MVTWPWPRPPWVICHPQAWICYSQANSQICSLYLYVLRRHERQRECRNRGGLEYLRSLTVTENKAYKLLLAFLCNYNYLYSSSFLRSSEILIENRRFWPTLPAFGAVVRVTLLEFYKGLWRRRTRSTWLSFTFVCIMICLAMLIEHQLVSERQTDGRTDGHMAIAYAALA